MLAATWAWYYWWPKSDSTDFIGHVVDMFPYLLFPWIIAMVCASNISDAMTRNLRPEEERPMKERLAIAVRAVGGLIGAGIHLLQYHWTLLVWLGWIGGLTLGFGLGYVIERDNTDYNERNT
jgi:hypothetical protein